MDAQSLYFILMLSVCYKKINNLSLYIASQGKGECLEDEPADNDYAYPDLPSGAMYNAEHQCRLQFGVREASVCSPLQEVSILYLTKIVFISLNLFYLNFC